MERCWNVYGGSDMMSKVCFQNNTGREKWVGDYELIGTRKLIILSSLLFICIFDTFYNKKCIQYNLKDL